MFGVTQFKLEYSHFFILRDNWWTDGRGGGQKCRKLRKTTFFAVRLGSTCFIIYFYEFQFSIV